MWKRSLKNVDSDNNKIFYETLLDFLQRNGTYFLNKPRTLLFWAAFYRMLPHAHEIHVSSSKVEKMNTLSKFWKHSIYLYIPSILNTFQVKNKGNFIVVHATRAYGRWRYSSVHS